MQTAHFDGGAIAIAIGHLLFAIHSRAAETETVI